MSHLLLHLVAVFLVLTSTVGFARSEPVTEADLMMLDLGSIDQTIFQITVQVARLKDGAGRVLGNTVTDTETGTEKDAQDKIVGFRTSRARTNALCFQDSLTGHRNVTELDDFFAGLEGMVERLDVVLMAFDNLKLNNVQGQCPSYMQEMLASMQSNIGEVSRRDLSDLVFHLESCWPDDGVMETDGSTLDIDSRYQRARVGLQSYARGQRAVREATGWCK